MPWQMADSKYILSPTERLCGVPWYLKIMRKDEHLGVFLFCDRKIDEENPWTVDAKYECRLVSAAGTIKKNMVSSSTFSGTGFGWCPFVSWKDAIEDGGSKVVCDVIIDRMVGFDPEIRWTFENPVEHLTDVVLQVEEDKFHVSKTVLAIHSTYFMALFFGNFEEAKKSEIELKDVDSVSFQSFLEVLYGEFEITAHNVADILILADKFDVQLVRNNCEKFLLANDQVSKKEKLCLADAFKLENLMKECLESMKTSDDIKANLPANLSDLSQPTVVAVLQKLLPQ